jgi:hypothetical protein
VELLLQSKEYGKRSKEKECEQTGETRKMMENEKSELKVKGLLSNLKNKKCRAGNVAQVV